MTLKKDELIAEIAKRADTTKIESRKHLDLALAIIKESLSEGNAVDLPGFGKFSVKDVAEHMGRNPKTGEQILIAKTRKVKFSASKPLSDFLNGK